MRKQISNYVVVSGTAGFTDVMTGEVHGVEEMLSLGFTADDLVRCR